MASVTALSAPPVLSTPDTHIFEEPTPPVDTSLHPHLADNELLTRYEVDRTIRAIRKGGWRRVALQFPDEMVGEGVRVYGFLKQGLRNGEETAVAEIVDSIASLEVDHTQKGARIDEERIQLCILADTSYGSCCVDEIAAEHVDAEVVVHYGRACLSPTARLPVIHVFTTQDLDPELVAKAFKEIYEDKIRRIILMGDLPFQSHLSNISNLLYNEGYTEIITPKVLHNPSSLIPNRQLPEELTPELLKEYALFHVGQPPTALLLTLSSRLSNIHIYSSSGFPKALPANSTPTLRRRYALLTSLSTVSIFGILLNTLSVKNYLHIVTHIQSLISRAGKKSYTFVVGKINPAKVANFAEIGGWVVVGCWESSLVESRDFYRPLITPFELELALMKDKDRLWAGEWRSDFESVLSRELEASNGDDEDEDEADEDEDAPPEFDLRTGRYVSQSRPMRVAENTPRSSQKSTQNGSSSKTLIKRANGELALVGGIVSPGAEYLQSARSWTGLGSEYEIRYDEEPGARVEEGRSGVARGYTVGDDTSKR